MVCIFVCLYDCVIYEFDFLVDIVGGSVVAKCIVYPFGEFWPLCFIVVDECFSLVGYDVFLGYEDGCENR